MKRCWDPVMKPLGHAKSVRAMKSGMEYLSPAYYEYINKNPDA